MNQKIKISIVGARGYTGQELVKILLAHPHSEIKHLYASEEGPEFFDEEFPYFGGRVHLPVEKWDIDSWKKDEDLIFLALPHCLAMQAMPKLLKEGAKVIDLSADYRLKEIPVFEKWYHVQHQDKGNIKQAVYGLPELHKEEIQKAFLIANPGCYPTSAILGLAPLMKAKEAKLDTIIVDSKSGVSGAGRKPSLTTHFVEVEENFRAYSLTNHRHIPEMEEQLTLLAGKKVSLTFTPHLLPINRGILSTIYIDLKDKLPEQEWIARYKRFYKEAPLVRVRPQGNMPQIKEVSGLNYCDIGLCFDRRTSRLIVVSVIDNLLKGASGQAVQNMNLMFGFKETEGLI